MARLLLDSELLGAIASQCISLEKAVCCVTEGEVQETSEVQLLTDPAHICNPTEPAISSRKAVALSSWL